MAAKKNINLNELQVKDLKPAVVPLLSLAGLIILALFSFNFMSQKVSAQKARLSSTKRNESILIEKRRVLAEFDAISTEEISALTSVLPDKNASLIMLSQIKRIARDLGLSFSNLNINPAAKTKGDIYTSQMKFDVDGNITSLIGFIKILQDYAPVKTIDTVRFINSGGLVRGEIALAVYSSPFPKKIPAITEAIKGLSTSEFELLTELSNMTLPAFTELIPESPGARTNPFE